MKAIEFQSQLEHGIIQVPEECGLLDGQDVRVLILVNEVAANQTVPSASPFGSVTAYRTRKWTQWIKQQY